MSKDSGTQTTQVQPWGPARPYVEQGLQGAQTLLQQGGPQQYGGQTVVPFSQPTQQALALQSQRALQGSPVNAAAQNLATGTLRGDFLNSNPYLDATFQRGANQIGNNLDTLFARSGRDLVGQAPARGEALASYATQLYGGNYANERQNQQQAMAFAPTLAAQDYVDTAQLRDVGSTVENLAQQQALDAQRRFDFEQMRPELALDAFNRRIAGGASGYNQQVQPMYQNRGAGALGGALVGSQLGFGLPGTIIGGLLGGFG
jgi:hypothetical protein